MFNGQTFTLTYSECVENHAGMQQVGQKLPPERGTTVEELHRVYDYYQTIEQYRANVEIYDLNYQPDLDPAAILVIRNGLDMMGIDHELLFREQDALEKDKKAFMYGRVVNKIARHNLCFADFDQQPNYEERRGTIVNFSHLPLTSCVRDRLPLLLDVNITEEVRFAEGNYYYNNKCSIGAHSDGERNKVIGVRLGERMNLCFQWYQNSKIISDKFELFLNSGDIYVMSIKALGYDGKKRSKKTLKHSANK